MDAHEGRKYAVRHGLAMTGRVITAAAIIMIAVFGAFAIGNERALAMMGVGFAAAIFIDAFIIRLLLLPAVMHIAGPAMWWMPSGSTSGCPTSTSSVPTRTTSRPGRRRAGRAGAAACVRLSRGTAGSGPASPGSPGPAARSPARPVRSRVSLHPNCGAAPCPPCPTIRTCHRRSPRGRGTARRVALSCERGHAPGAGAARAAGAAVGHRRPAARRPRRAATTGTTPQSVGTDKLTVTFTLRAATHADAIRSAGLAAGTLAELLTAPQRPPSTSRASRSSFARSSRSLS